VPSTRAAQIAYCIDDNNEMTIDVKIDDYSQETLEKFSLLFASVPTEAFQVQAMQILQQAFANDGKQNEFEFFLAQTLIKQKLLGNSQQERQKGENDPLIAPTDLI
jgi:hypothetical protein